MSNPSNTFNLVDNSECTAISLNQLCIFFSRSPQPPYSKSNKGIYLIVFQNTAIKSVATFFLEFLWLFHRSTSLWCRVCSIPMRGFTQGKHFLRCYYCRQMLYFYLMMPTKIQLECSGLSHRYDIKGCEVGRWTNQNSGDSHVITVLKDNNFNGKHITLGKSLDCKYCPQTASASWVTIQPSLWELVCFLLALTAGTQG